MFREDIIHPLLFVDLKYPKRLPPAILTVLDVCRDDKIDNSVGVSLGQNRVKFLRRISHRKAELAVKFLRDLAIRRVRKGAGRRLPENRARSVGDSLDGRVEDIWYHSLQLLGCNLYPPIHVEKLLPLNLIVYDPFGMTGLPVIATVVELSVA